MPQVYAAKRRETFKDAGYIVMKHYEKVDSTLHMNINLPDSAIEVVSIPLQSEAMPPFQVLHELAKIHSSGQFFSEDDKAKLTNNLFQNTFNVWFEEGVRMFHFDS